jgi:ribosomal protein S18 acetylase RimI-like enzyme
VSAIGAAPRVEPLAAHHDRAAFTCGEPALDRYIREQASQDVRRRLAQVFVAIGDTPGSIAGYYSLSAASFGREHLPQAAAKRLPRYPVPAAIIGRLAVATEWQGRRLGTFLLLNAVERVIAASASMAVYAVVVDAKTERAVDFYRRFGFIPFPAAPERLFLPLSDFLAAGLQP